MHSLLETMYNEKGIGIAAIQVGVPLRALIIDIPNSQVLDCNSLDVKNTPLFIINPEIIHLSEDKIVLKEGCLSVKKDDDSNTYVRGDVLRPTSINITYTDLDDQLQKLEIDGTQSEYHMWLSRCVQHEFDHFDGVLFIDKLYNQNVELHNDEIAVLNSEDF